MEKNSKGAATLRQEAAEVVGLCRRLDYAAILDHRPEAVAELRAAVKTLRHRLGGAPRVEPAEPPVSAESLQDRRRRYVEALNHAGLGGRLGKLYCSWVDERVVPFREAPHKRGLPTFDMVVAADFAPVDGYHGIFIAAQEVFSCTLPRQAEEKLWQVRARARYGNVGQMVDVVAALSAGFPVG